MQVLHWQSTELSEQPQIEGPRTLTSFTLTMVSLVTVARKQYLINDAVS